MCVREATVNRNRRDSRRSGGEYQQRFWTEKTNFALAVRYVLPDWRASDKTKPIFIEYDRKFPWNQNNDTCKRTTAKKRNVKMQNGAEREFS